jgi:hypothetical protein
MFDIYYIHIPHRPNIIQIDNILEYIITYMGEPGLELLQRKANDDDLARLQAEYMQYASSKFFTPKETDTALITCKDGNVIDIFYYDIDTGMVLKA